MTPKMVVIIAAAFVLLVALNSALYIVGETDHAGLGIDHLERDLQHPA